MAVGGIGMLSTSNYAARKFGVRAAMPGLGKKKIYIYNTFWILSVDSNIYLFRYLHKKIYQIEKVYLHAGEIYFPAAPLSFSNQK